MTAFFKLLNTLTTTCWAFCRERKGCCFLLCLLMTVQGCSSQDHHSFHVLVVASLKLVGDWHPIEYEKIACRVI